MRLFVAADVPDAAREAIAAEQKRIASALSEKEREPFPPALADETSELRRTRRSAVGARAGRRAGPLKWVKPDHSHLTLVFLGDVEDARIASVTEAIGQGVNAAPFDIVFEGLGVFPPRGAPRVLWVGVGAGASALIDLQHELTRRIAALGIPLEDRRFHPHLTLARWRESRSSDRQRALAHAPKDAVARAHITGATLYQSRLSPAGPTYTALARANLSRSA
jgi:2'-5' RNA ligase